MALDLTGLGSFSSMVQSVIERIWPNKDDQEKAKAALEQAQLQGQLADIQAQWDNARAQAAVNQAEASNNSVFVAGWRPFVGWICGSALAWNFIVYPMFAFFAAVFHSPIDPKTVPELDMGLLGQLLIGMLGLGVMRTYEKIKGVAPATHG